MRGKSLKERFRSVTYMQTSLTLFAVSAALCIYLCIRSVTTNGSLKPFEGFLGLLSLFGSIAGFIVPLYGRFVVGAQTKTDYRIGAVLNGLLMLWLIFLYFLGL